MTNSLHIEKHIWGSCVVMEVTGAIKIDPGPLQAWLQEWAPGASAPGDIRSSSDGLDRQDLALVMVASPVGLPVGNVPLPTVETSSLCGLRSIPFTSFNIPKASPYSP